jgi:putative redox protein
LDFKMNEKAFESTFEYGRIQISNNEENGFRPFQLFVASVAACSGEVLRKVMEKMRLTFEDIEVNAKVIRDEKKANRITDIQLHFVISGQDLSADKIKKALVAARKNCAMVQSVKECIHITESFEIR